MYIIIIIIKFLVTWQFSGPYGVTKYDSGWRKDVVNQCLESGLQTDDKASAIAYYRMK